MTIGNWAAYIRWDTLVRVLQAQNYNVNWIMNITDVGHLVSDGDEGEDKLEKGAKREGKSAWEVAKFYSEDFMHGLRELNISIPHDHLFRATDYIDQQIKLIKQLETKGYSYIIDDGVYFDTSKLPDYGKLAQLKIADLKAGARVVHNNQKKNITDFALWKFSPKVGQRDMEWDSPWGKGFPGWHIECSAMALDRLGKTLDIHAGGIDHIAVHHTNEIAQSEAANGRPLANLWLHGNFLLVDGKKMSKSLDNWFTLNDVKNKGFNPIEFRLLILQSHYQTEANFSWQALDAAATRLKVIGSMADYRFQVRSDSKGLSADHIRTARNAILAALNQNLNTPQALAFLSELEAALAEQGLASSCQQEFTSFVMWLDEIFGLRLSSSVDISPDQKQILTTRQKARHEADWQKSDQLRSDLAEQLLEIKDTTYGQVWRRL